MALTFQAAASSIARRFSGILAASLMAVSSAVAPIPATAREIERDIEGLPPHCAKLDGDVAKYKCGSAYYQSMRRDGEAQSADAKARSADAKARSANAKARAAASDAENACIDLIMSDLKANGTKTAKLKEPPKKGEACQLAKTLKLTAG